MALLLVLLYTRLNEYNYSWFNCILDYIVPTILVQNIINLEYLYSWFFCILDYIFPTKRVQNIFTPGSTVNQTIQFQLYLFRIYLLLVQLYTGLYSSNYTCLEYLYSWFYCILDYIVPTIPVQNIFTSGSPVYWTLYSSNYTSLEYLYSWFYCILDYIVPTIPVQNIFTPGSPVYWAMQLQLHVGAQNLDSVFN